EIAAHLDAVPRRGVSDIAEVHVVVEAPEERHVAERLSAPQHGARRSLALALRHDPVLDPDELSEARLGIARDVSRGEHSGGARLSRALTTTPSCTASPADSASPVRGRTPTP